MFVWVNSRCPIHLSYDNDKNLCDKQKGGGDAEYNSVVNFICRREADDDRVAGEQHQIGYQQREEDLFVFLIHFRFAHPTG